ncbi:winged helix-turn-helix transcriptional regulator [Novosphingobium olei]|uniref:Helix-turn-helix transcriptional regulator n=1 Tax=Novosphingobium olei TaxID=2728851 RepID=A0A7Y0BMA9_9SPHN|nr:helix-turn-helix domain-containing protein [Novosphingobium olei]NML93002.1 helix-turn-helix transcriptional regulator [Novosphingobium olei]
MTAGNSRHYPPVSPEVEALVEDVIGRVADKWTMIVIEALEEHGTLRFSEIWRAVPRISQKMLTQTLRRMERDGLVSRTIHACVPPRVDYALTELGSTLSEAFCGVWQWAEAHHAAIDAARARFDGISADKAGA